MSGRWVSTREKADTGEGIHEGEGDSEDRQEVGIREDSVIEKKVTMVMMRRKAPEGDRRGRLMQVTMGTKVTVEIDGRWRRENREVEVNQGKSRSICMVDSVQLGIMKYKG